MCLSKNSGLLQCSSYEKYIPDNDISPIRFSLGLSRMA